MRLVLDLEANGLKPTKIWCVCLKDIDNGKTYSFVEDYKGLDDLLKRATLLVGHNVIDYDLPVLHRLLGIEIDERIVRDTLILSRLFNYPLEGGHSLGNLGSILGHKKQEHHEWNAFSPEMLSRCQSDVEIQHKVYVWLSESMKDPQWRVPIDCEHKMAYICRGMHENGFYFDKDQALKIQKELQERCSHLDVEIQAAFPPKTVISKEVRPSLTKNGLHKKDFKWYKGTDYTCFGPAEDDLTNCFSLFEWEEFNPKSSKQIIERLEGMWSPVDKTKGHKVALKERSPKLPHFQKYGWMINEVNLGTLKDDAPVGAKLLVERLLLGSRITTLESWLTAYNEDTHKIHGNFNTLGTWTHRLSHSNPNLGNVSAEKTIKYKSKHLRELAIDYGGRMRRLFQASPGKTLVGTDMEGAHLRLFAHFINDPTLIKALISGDKKLGTDPHSLNKQRLGEVCPDRDLAKTFIFTFLNGGGIGKVMEIFQCSRAEAEDALSSFIESYPGLAMLKQDRIPTWAKQGFFVGLDGRKVPCASEHHMIAGILQNGEKVVMAHANILWQRELKKLGIPFKQVNLVHDEFQTEVEDNEEIARMVGTIQSDAIRIVGERFGVLCPLAGEFTIGKDWLESH